MKKGFKAVQINGIAGLILALVTVGIILGSIAIMPIYGVKLLWNSFLSENFGIQPIRLSQASLLWFAILALAVGYIKSKIQFKFVNTIDLQNNGFTSVDYEKFIEKIKKEQEENEKINR